jgi:peptidoglycan/LPS O-acetylase OafA/YrhL
VNSSTLGILALALVLTGLFSFASVCVWAHQRRREREAYYRSETLRRFSETGGAARELLLEALQEDERYTRRRRLEACKLAGVVTLAVGIAMMMFIKAVDVRSVEPSYLVGLIPVSVGVSLLLYVYLLAPRESARLPRDKP